MHQAVWLTAHCTYSYLLPTPSSSSCSRSSSPCCCITIYGYSELPITVPLYSTQPAACTRTAGILEGYRWRAS